jgi:signal transduction histidine kinase
MRIAARDGRAGRAERSADGREGRTLSLQRMLLLLVATSLLTVLIPAGVVLDRQLARELENRERRELAVAPRVLADRNAVLGGALRMRAEKLARAPGVAEPLRRRDRAAALRALEAYPDSSGGSPVVADAEGRILPEPLRLPAGMVDETRPGRTSARVVSEPGISRMVVLAPVERDGRWVGAAGISLVLDSAVAATLAGLTRSGVVFTDPGGAVTAGTFPAPVARAVAEAARARAPDGRVHRATVLGERYLISRAPLGDGACAVFTRDLGRELAVLRTMRWVVWLSAAAALALGLALAAAAAARLARPVRSLAGAADRLAAGDFSAPLEPSHVREFHRLGQAFAAMRSVLAARLEELGGANRELADRQTRLTALQWELLQRERLAASGRLAAQLAHEIRNPVASVRNCLELLHRRLRDDPQGREFARIAIDELLRMHELAERMLDVNRPRPPGPLQCDVAAAAREVAALVRVGVAEADFRVAVEGGAAHASIEPDTLKQVLLNLIQNARDASPHGLEVTITVRSEAARVSVEVCDNGPGIPAAILPRVFDPFFTTKGTVGGVGLGLFVAEMIVRTHGGRITARNLDGPGGACFLIELVPAEDGGAASARPAADDNLEPNR